MMKPLPGHKALDHREFVRQKVLHGLAIGRITQTSHSFHLFPKPVQTRSFPTTVSFSCKLALNMKQLVDLWMVPTW